MPADNRSVPLDPDSKATLAAAGLEYAVVADEPPVLDEFVAAVSRGFLDPRPTAEQIASSHETMRTRRKAAVYDRAGVLPDAPVATIDSWASELTVSPGRTAPLWAISAVTVASTHRRRGIARAMLGGELRAARGAGFAIVGLTVSEATIYGRWGFSPAAFATQWRIDARRARWSGPTPEGRLDVVAQEALPELLETVYERIRLQRPGRVPGWPGLWRGTAGLRPGADDAAKVRGVSFRDAHGEVRGVMVYVLIPHADDYSRHELEVRALYADGADASAALWRFALEHDLVATVTASLRPVDDPLPWMIADRRAARATVVDHHWLRVVDVPGALSSRDYSVADTVTLRVHDDLGFADGTWRLASDAAGRARVEPTDDTPEVELSVNALGSLLLGGVLASTLAEAGALTASAAVVERLDRLFRPQAVPLLDLWY